MCIDERTSWTTLILGTALNIAALHNLKKNKDRETSIVVAIVVAWQYALLMQIPDALAWRDLQARYPGVLAFILNVTQPFVVVACVAAVVDDRTRLYPALAAVLVYAIVVVRAATRTSFDLSPPPGCANLSYPWGVHIPIALYMAVVLLAVAAIPSVPYAALSAAIFLGSVVITRAVVPAGCSITSLWCWVVASAGFITFLFAMARRYWKREERKSDK